MPEPEPIIDPEALWMVKFFNRIGFMEVEVQAGNEVMAETFARGSLSRDGFDMTNLSLIEVKRIG